MEPYGFRILNLGKGIALAVLEQEIGVVQAPLQEDILGEHQHRVARLELGHEAVHVCGSSSLLGAFLAGSGGPRPHSGGRTRRGVRC